MNITRLCNSIVWEDGEHDPTSRGRVTITGSTSGATVIVDYWYVDIMQFMRLDRLVDCRIEQNGDEWRIEGNSTALLAPVVVSILMQPLCKNCGANR